MIGLVIGSVRRWHLVRPVPALERENEADSDSKLKPQRHFCKNLNLSSPSVSAFFRFDE